MTASDDVIRARPSHVDVEAGKVRAGLHSSAPVNARRMDHVNISVRDLDASAGFYAALLGIDLKEQGDNGTTRWCILGAPDRFYVCLCEISSGSFQPKDIHINHVGFVVDDIDEAVRRIQALGLPLEFGKTLDWTRSRSAYVKDPDGILIEFTNRFGGGLD
jgi:catechol 2,3-dioxygenase-like lactoylglutathione lyase family enzyme